MNLPQLTLRDLFWLVALVAMGCGWWVDQYRIQRERAALQAAEKAFAVEREVFRAGTARIADAKVSVAEATLQVAEFELEHAMAANKKTPGRVPENEVRRLEATRDIARIEFDKARTTNELLGPATNTARPTVPQPGNTLLGSP